jgi:hypothetical protein
MLEEPLMMRMRVEESLEVYFSASVMVMAAVYLILGP